MTLHFLFEPRELAARLVEEHQVLLRDHRADQLVGPRIQLGPPDIESRRQQRHFIVGNEDRRLGIRLDDLLIRQHQLEIRLLERELLFAGVELRDQVALLHRRPRVRE